MTNHETNYSRYEGGVWTYFLAVVGFALFGIVVWIGLLLL